MINLHTTTHSQLALPADIHRIPLDDAQLAAAAFLARYRGRTLDAYRYDLRVFFQWAADMGIEVLAATRPQIELYVRSLEERGLAATTVDRRISTICGLYRFAHIDGRIASNPAQYGRRPKVQDSTARGLDRSELGAMLFTAERFDPAHAALVVLLGLNGLRVSEACGANIEDLAFERATASCALWARATSPPSSPWYHAPPALSTSPWGNGRRVRSCSATTANAWTAEQPTAGCVPSPSGPGSATCIPTCSEAPSSWPPSKRRAHARRADRNPSLRAPHHRRLRPPPPKLRQARRLRCRRLRRRRLTA